MADAEFSSIAASISLRLEGIAKDCDEYNANRLRFKKSICLSSSSAEMLVSELKDSMVQSTFMFLESLSVSVSSQYAG